MNLPPFESFPSIPRLKRTCCVSEKLDGSNAQIYIPDDSSFVAAGSRNRWITPQDDNYDGGHLFMGEALPVGGGGDGPDNVNAVAVWCNVGGGGVPGTMFYDVDFVRFEQGAADWLP
jgi:hypothetical protein